MNLHRRFKWWVTYVGQFRLVRDITIKEEDSHVAITHLIVLWNSFLLEKHDSFITDGFKSESQFAGHIHLSV